MDRDRCGGDRRCRCAIAVLLRDYSRWHHRDTGPEMTILPLLLKQWKLGIIAALMLALWLTNGRVAHWKAQASAEHTAHAETVASYRAAADKAAALDLANALRVERQQTEIAQNVAADTDTRLADVRARLERLRAEAKADPSSSSGADLPDAALSTGSAACPADALGVLADAEENTVKLMGWQKWWEGVEKLSR